MFEILFFTNFCTKAFSDLVIPIKYTIDNVEAKDTKRVTNSLTISPCISKCVAIGNADANTVTTTAGNIADVI